MGEWMDHDCRIMKAGEPEKTQAVVLVNFLFVFFSIFYATQTLCPFMQHAFAG